MSSNQSVSQFCVYTILHTGRLEKFLRQGGSGEATEKHVWVSGERLFLEAKRAGMRMPIIFGAAEADNKGLIYQATLETVKTDEEKQTTTYRFTNLKEIPGSPPLHSLKKKSDNRPLSDEFIRPYSICYTPSFVE